MPGTPTDEDWAELDTLERELLMVTKIVEALLHLSPDQRVTPEELQVERERLRDARERFNRKLDEILFLLGGQDEEEEEDETDG